MKKRILSILLALCMCLTFVPVTVLAEDLPQQDNSIRAFSISPDPDNTTYCTYEFYVNGEKVDTQIVKNGDTLLEPQVEAQDGKVFTGWDQEVPFGKISGLTGENTTIRVDAVFADGYHVYFKDNNGRIIATKTVANGTEVTFEDVNFPVGSDEAITGWYEDTGLTKKVDSVTINGADITLYAKVEKGYWLTFESNGGSEIESVHAARHTRIDLTSAKYEPVRRGYIFTGWYEDKALTKKLTSIELMGSRTVYAGWQPDTMHFDDVRRGDWFYDDAAYVYANGLMSGTSAYRFSPDLSTTRAMIVTILWRIAGEPAPKAENTFSDVAAGQWYTDAITWAAENDVVNGVGDGRFDPEGKITREQMATILFRYAGSLGADTSKRAELSGYPDGGKTADWASDAVQWAVAEGIIYGSEGKLLPQDSATRAQVATILYRSMELITE